MAPKFGMSFLNKAGTGLDSDHRPGRIPASTSQTTSGTRVRAKNTPPAEAPLGEEFRQSQPLTRRQDSFLPCLPTACAPRMSGRLYNMNTDVGPDKFYKRSQEKNTSSAAGCFLAFQPTPWSRIAVAFRSVISGRCFIQAARLVFSASGFHHLGGRSQSVRIPQERGCQVPTMVPFGTRWSIAFSGCPRGTRIAERRSVRRHAEPN